MRNTIYNVHTLSEIKNFCTYIVRNEEYATVRNEARTHTLSEIKNIPYIHCQKLGIVATTYYVAILYILKRVPPSMKNVAY